MAKVNYSSLKLKINNSIKSFTIGENEIEVLQYLPIEDKSDLITISIQKGIKDGLYNPLKLDMYFHLFIVYMYTNISFTTKQREDEEKLYNVLKSNGIIDKVLELIPEDEYNELLVFLEEESEVTQKYKNSLIGVINSFINELPTQAEAAMEIVNNFDKEKFSNIIDFAKTINNGKIE